MGGGRGRRSLGRRRAYSPSWCIALHLLAVARWRGLVGTWGELEVPPMTETSRACSVSWYTSHHLQQSSSFSAF